jgi:cystathionine gamma-synthase
VAAVHFPGLVCHPATMTHAAMSAEAQESAGIAGNLLRLSVGIERGADLVRDLLAGLARAQSAQSLNLSRASTKS